MNRRDVFATMAAGGIALAGPAHALAQTPTDDETANVDTVRRYFTDFREARNSQALHAIVSPDYVSQDPEAAPGIDAYILRSEDYFRGLEMQYTEYHWTEDAIIGSGSSVVWRGHEGGTTTDGKLANVLYLYWFELNADHLITTFWAGIDPKEAFMFP